MAPVARLHLRASVELALRRAPIVLLSGPRQCGKTTLAKEIAVGRRGVYFDLEDPATPVRAEAARESWLRSEVWWSSTSSSGGPICCRCSGFSRIERPGMRAS